MTDRLQPRQRAAGMSGPLAAGGRGRYPATAGGRAFPHVLAAGGALLAGLALVAGCTDAPLTDSYRDTGVPAGTLRLVPFDSCADALGRLKQAAKRYVGPWGFGDPVADASKDDRAVGPPVDAAPRAPADAGGDLAAAKPAPEAGTPNYSGTNTHEAGVNEPDIIKTDGRRIVTVSRGVLRVIDARTRRLTGTLDLRSGPADPVRWLDVDLLLHGDRALVLVSTQSFAIRGPVIDWQGETVPAPNDVASAKLMLIDLAGPRPVVASVYRADGSLIDARQVGATVGVMLRSAPRLNFPYEAKLTNAQRIAANKAIIEAAGPDDWLPRYTIIAGDQTIQGRVDCSAVYRPARYSGTTMVTLLRFDLTRSTLTNGDPLTVVADGNVVYSNGTSLYLANDQRWWVGPPRDNPQAAEPAFDGDPPATQPMERTELYKFDISGTGRARYVAAGAVDGWLINQYALSEWDGHLRVATTMGSQQSTVYVLRQQGDRLVETGKVTGLGKGERIYAVRFVGPIGYVVTFRQTDPLYTVDLHDPATPRLLGELKISGYSAYLHPIGDDRLIGVGQEANSKGRVQGTQVSLFDVRDLTKPSRITQYHVRYANSEAEFDPHAFLYWPATGHLVIPLSVYNGQDDDGGAVVLHINGAQITEVGRVSHPSQILADERLPGQIRRALVIDNVLWTLSSSGVKASDLATLATLVWIPWD